MRRSDNRYRQEMTQLNRFVGPIASMEAHVPISTMDRIKTLEEALREAACVGDIDVIQDLLDKGIDINSRHEINGWSALHWAAKRGHRDVVTLLLENGAERNVLTNKGEAPISLCSHPEIRQLLDPESVTGCSAGPIEELSLPIMPNYLKHAPLNGKVDLGHTTVSRRATNTTATSNSSTSGNIGKGVSQSQMINGQTESDELVLKVRVSNNGDPDFIEVELPRAELTYSRLLRTCCEELNVTPTQVFRIRKLPDTIVRKDKDVQRLTDFQEMEIVVATDRGSRLIAGSNGLVSVNGGVNSYQSISLYKNQTILY